MKPVKLLRSLYFLSLANFRQKKIKEEKEKQHNVSWLRSIKSLFYFYTLYGIFSKYFKCNSLALARNNDNNTIF